VGIDTRRRLCLDCLGSVCERGADPLRCPSCGSPRQLDLDRAQGLTIAHIDCDAFYASIEKRDDPALRDSPVIVGGAGRRGVVSTCCYVARTFGVRSAMPMREALRLCPQAAVVPPRMSAYSAVARDIRGLMSELTPAVEPVSIDEAFLDLTGCERANGGSAALTLARFARRIEREVGVTVSIGLSDCKFLAKLASDFEKPRGFRVIPRDAAIQTLAPLDIGRLWGVGKVARASLIAKGFRLIGDLQRLSEAQALARLGPQGRRIWRLSHGLDDRRVSADRESKSVSSESTFEFDVSAYSELAPILLSHCERVASRLRKSGLAARQVTLKLRLSDFRLITRVRSSLEPTQLAPKLFAAARQLLEQLADGRPFRLIGMSAGDLAEATSSEEPDFFADQTSRDVAREDAIEALRDRFGPQALLRGLAFEAKSRKPL